MSTETKERKNPDYSNTAVGGITNPVEVWEAYQKWQAVNAIVIGVESKIKEQTAELQGKLEIATKYAGEARDELIKAINEHGCYQDTETGTYALKIVRTSKVYKAQPFIENFPKFAPTCIEQVINKSALEGLVKGGLIKEQELIDTGVQDANQTEAYIIR